MTPKLSPRTSRLIETLFKPDEVVEASQRLEEQCGNDLPFCQNSNETQMERIRFATIKLSNGELPNLLKAISEARKDWRDLLVMAGFAERVEAHDLWAKEILNEV